MLSFELGNLTAVALADRVFLVVLAVEVELQHVLYLACLLGQTILLHQRHDGQLHGCQGSRQAQHYAGVATLEFLLLVRGAEHAEEHTVYTDRGLDNVGHIALVELGVKVLDALARVLLVLREVEVGAAVDICTPLQRTPMSIL